MASDHIPKYESKRINLRHAIYYQYEAILDSPPKPHWRGKGGTIALIRKALQLPPHHRRVIKRTLNEIMRCMVEGEDFDGRLNSRTQLGEKFIILPGSVEENLITNWTEAHCGFRFTTEMVNEHRRQQGLVEVSRYCVMSVFYSLRPKMDVLQKRGFWWP